MKKLVLVLILLAIPIARGEDQPYDALGGLTAAEYSEKIQAEFKNSTEYNQIKDVSISESVSRQEAYAKELQEYNKNIAEYNKQLKKANRKAAFANFARAAALGMAAGAQGYNQAVQSQQRQRLNCTTQYIGNQAYTNCY